MIQFPLLQISNTANSTGELLTLTTSHSNFKKKREVPMVYTSINSNQNQNQVQFLEHAGMEAGSQTSEREYPSSELGLSKEKHPIYTSNSRSVFKHQKSRSMEPSSSVMPQVHLNSKIDAGSVGEYSSPTPEMTMMSMEITKPKAKRYHDLGTNASSGHESDAPWRNSFGSAFENVFQEELAYFQKCDGLVSKSFHDEDTDGSVAISEGSSTAEGAASAAEGWH